METYQTLLEQHGFSAKEASVYLALLALGVADVSTVATQAHLKRPTTYFVLDDLVKRGVVSAAGGKVKKFIAEKPQKIFSQEKAKLSHFEQALPGLVSLLSKSKHTPSVRFFSGLDGVRSVYEESLLQPAHAEMLALGNAKAVETSLPDFGQWYIQRRVEAKIRMRALTTDTPYHKILVARDKKELRQTRLLEKQLFTQDVEINIYGKTVSMISFVDDEFVGIIIVSAVFAAGHKQLFELLWTMGQ